MIAVLRFKDPGQRFFTSCCNIALGDKTVFFWGGEGWSKQIIFNLPKYDEIALREAKI